MRNASWVNHDIYTLQKNSISAILNLTVNSLFTLHWTAYTLPTQLYITLQWAVLIQCKAYLYWTEHPQPKSYTSVSRLTNTHTSEPLRLRPIELIASESVELRNWITHWYMKHNQSMFLKYMWNSFQRRDHNTHDKCMWHCLHGWMIPGTQENGLSLSSHQDQNILLTKTGGGWLMGNGD